MKMFVFNSWTRRGVTAAVLAVCLGLAGAASAGGFGHWGKGHHDDGERMERRAHKMAERLEKRLELSDSQEERVEAIFAESLAAAAEARTERRSAMRELWMQDSLDADEVRAVLRARREGKERADADMRETREEIMAETIAKIHAVLTPEQRMRAAEMGGLRLMGDHGRGRHGKGRGRGGRHDDDDHGHE